MIHRVVEGPADAPVLVLSNSLGTSLGMWDEVAERLRERVRLVRYDQRGHGATPAPPGPYSLADLGGDVVALLDELGLERASFCGLSLGGMTGMWLAAHAPERVDRLGLCCTSPHMPPPEAWRERIAGVRAAGSTEVMADATIERWFTPAFQGSPAAARLREMIATTSVEGYTGCCEALAEMDLRGDLPSIRAPTLVVAGADDPSTPPAHGERIAAAIPGARLEVLAGAAHMAAVERPGEVAALVLDHLDLQEPR